MALSEKDRRALIVGGIALGVIVVYVAAVEPSWTWYDGLVERHGTQAASVTHLRVNQRKAQYYTERVTEFEKKAGVLQAPKPYSEQITAVTSKVMLAAQESGFKLKNAAPTAAVAWPDDPGLQMASILVDGEAGWEEVFKFIGALYRVEGVISVEQMELNGKGGSFTVKLTVSVLVKAPEQGSSPWAR